MTLLLFNLLLPLHVESTATQTQNQPNQQDLDRFWIQNQMIADVLPIQRPQPKSRPYGDVEKISPAINAASIRNAARQSAMIWGGIALSEMLLDNPEQSLVDMLGTDWLEESRPRPALLLLGLEKITWKCRPWNDPPFVMKIDPTGRQNKASIILSMEAIQTKMNIPFKYAKTDMDDVHLWMKIGTGFQETDQWLRIEFARPPPDSVLEMTEGFNWYITKATPPIIGDVSKSEPIKFTSLLDILNAIDDVGIPQIRESDGSDPYSALPGWLPKQHWNCYTALNELNVRLGIYDSLGKPFLYHFLKLVTLGAANGRRHGDQILTNKAREIKSMTQEKERRKKHNRECGLTGMCSLFGQIRHEDKRVSVSQNKFKPTFLISFTCVVSFFSFFTYIYCRKQDNDFFQHRLLLYEEI